MKRSELLARLGAERPWDIVVIGGGATGLGVALDATLRGFSVALVDAHDFAKGTSSRSTKLVHGGVRYLAQGNVGLVREALHERATLLASAPEREEQCQRAQEPQAVMACRLGAGVTTSR